jgi:ATP diphosphatase
VNKKAKNIKDLLGIMRALRAPGSGCPWDLKQNFDTISSYTVEEAYEVADAISRNDMDLLCEELGDLLFQVVYHTQMADENNVFNFNDVVSGICEKLIRRHPHVFENEKIHVGELSQRWEMHKAQERASKQNDAEVNEYLLDDLPNNIPALQRAYKLQQRSSSVGFDWTNIEPVLSKLEEEIAELKVELALMDNQRRIQEELGDIFFSCVNLARHLDVDPESSLRTTNRKFYERFCYIEDALKRAGKTINTCEESEMDVFWNEAKLALKKNA